MSRTGPIGLGISLDGSSHAFGPRGSQKYKPWRWKTLPTLSRPMPSGRSQLLRISASTIHRAKGGKTKVQDEQVDLSFKAQGSIRWQWSSGSIQWQLLPTDASSHNLERLIHPIHSLPQNSDQPLDTVIALRRILSGHNSSLRPAPFAK